MIAGCHDDGRWLPPALRGTRVLPRPEELTLYRERPVEVIVLTGFLGSGKTTLLRRLLSSAAFSDAAVIINEFGPEPLDHLLVEHGEDLTSVIEGGCLCCLPPNRLISLMAEMMRRHYLGELPFFRRLVIETSGLADPAPLLQSFANDPLRLGRYKLRAVITTIDGHKPDPALLSFGVAARQLAAADIVVLTKTDLMVHLTATWLKSEIEARSSARVFDSDGEFVDLLAAVTSEARLHPLGDPDSPTLPHQEDGQIYAAISRQLSHTVEVSRLQAWLSEIATNLGPRLLRLKGLVRIAGLEGSLEMQASGGHVFPFRQISVSAPSIVTIIVEKQDAEFADARLRALAGISLQPDLAGQGPQVAAP
ncbi:MAG TPA: GTP-binding protein [Dongiaceae bacterium]|nr:GTP-binding protein [Dongiaceae bacterium]